MPCEPPVKSLSRFASGTPTMGSAIVTIAIASPPRRAAASATSSPATAGIRQASTKTRTMFQSFWTPYAVTYAPRPRKKIWPSETCPV